MIDAEQHRQIRLLMQLMREFDASRLKVGAVEIELRPESVVQPPLKEVIGDAEGKPTEDELLFWSSGGAPDNRAEPPK